MFTQFDIDVAQDASRHDPDGHNLRHGLNHNPKISQHLLDFLRLGYDTNWQAHVKGNTLDPVLYKNEIRREYWTFLTCVYPVKLNGKMQPLINTHILLRFESMPQTYHQPWTTTSGLKFVENLLFRGSISPGARKPLKAKNNKGKGELLQLLYLNKLIS